MLRALRTHDGFILLFRIPDVLELADFEKLELMGWELNLRFASARI